MERKEAHICFCCRRLWGLSLLPALTWSSLLCNRMLTHFPPGCWKTNAPWGGGLMDLVSDSPVFPAWLSRSAAQRHPLCTLSCPRAPAAVVPAQEDFSCLGAAGVYGKRVGRGGGKAATVWLGGKALFWLETGRWCCRKLWSVAEKTLTASGGLGSSPQGLLGRGKHLSAWQGMAGLIMLFY